MAKAKNLTAEERIRRIEMAPVEVQAMVAKAYLREDIDDEDVWYMTFRHYSLGHVLVVINANDRMLDGIKQFIPRQLALKVFGSF